MYLGRCPRLYTSAPTARVDHSGSHVASWTLSLAIALDHGAVFSVRVDHSGSHVASWTLSLAIALDHGAVFSVRVGYTGAHVASWTLLLAMFGAVGNALSVHVAHTWVLMGITENVGTDMLIVETDLYVFRSRL